MDIQTERYHMVPTDAFECTREKDSFQVFSHNLVFVLGLRCVGGCLCGDRRRVWVKHLRKGEDGLLGSGRHLMVFVKGRI